MIYINKTGFISEHLTLLNCNISKLAVRITKRYEIIRQEKLL